MSRLAVIGTFYQRHENTPRIAQAIRDQRRQPDELWLMGEGEDDCAVLREQDWGTAELHILHVPTPRDAEGRYAVIPYSNKINTALDLLDDINVAYLDNGSIPLPDKYRAMVRGLDEEPVVYVAQQRTGVRDVTAGLIGVVHDAYMLLNYTQVAHRLTADRWTLDMGHANPDIADALFWRSLHASLGPFYPVDTAEVLDLHHIPSSSATGI